MNGEAGPEESGGAVGVSKAVPIDQWDTPTQMAFWAFHQQRRTDYMRYAYLQLGSDANAEEAVDLTFDQAMVRWPQMLQMENLEGYAWTILKRRIIDLHRKRRHRPELMETAAFEAALADPTEDPYDTLTDAIALYGAVAALSERQRDAIVLYYGMGFSAAEAAVLMGNEEATVRSQLRTGRLRLATLLKLRCPEPPRREEPLMIPQPLPPDRPTIDDLLAKARTHNRYASYDMAAAEARMRSRQAARHRPPRQRTADTAHVWAAWTAPEDDHTPDADRAWWDLNAVSLLVLSAPDADHQLGDFIDSQYADKTGALVFACLLHLAGDSSGARFWWRFAAGVGHLVAEYCLFLEHAHSGEYYDADYWRGQLLRHHFEPTYMCGDRADAPLLAPELIGQVHPHITRSHHPEIGTVPLPRPPLVQELRHLTTLL
ncbi:RNA polymerase sigma factor [Streptomyces sp. NBC_01396]|uniref:RNA polymerase sigma factor n=1 Tax=Streptomyces sp. NBC_01396 TaxID=2903852 RepID=UPI003244B52F